MSPKGKNMTNSEVATKIARDLIAERRARLDEKLAELKADPENDFDDDFIFRLKMKAIDAIDRGELII